MSSPKVKQLFIQDMPDDLIRKINQMFQASKDLRFVEGHHGGQWFSVTRSAFDVFVLSTERRFDVKVPSDVAEESKPTCPDHYLSMEFDPNNAIWVCPNFQCERKARKHLTIDDAEGQVISGDLHVYSVGVGDKEKFYLYIRQLNVFIDVNSRVHREGTGSVHGNPTFHLSLLFDGLHNKD